MRDSTTTPCVLFPELFDRPLTAPCDVPNASSDGGAVLLKAADSPPGPDRAAPAHPRTPVQSGRRRSRLVGDAVPQPRKK